MAAYWIKPTKSFSSPTTIVGIDVVYDEESVDGGDTHYVQVPRLVRVAASYRKYNKWVKPVELEFTEIEAVHDWLEGWAQAGRRTYVVGADAASALTHTRFWERCERYGSRWEIGEDGYDVNNDGQSGFDAYKFRDIVLRSTPDIVRYTVRGKGICWLSATQLIPAGNDDLKSHIDATWDKSAASCMGFARKGISTIGNHQLWLVMMVELSDWWRDVKGGAWAMTAPGLGYNYFRSRVKAKTILRHDNDKAKAVEEAALFGGRASVFYVGPVGYDSSEMVHGPQCPPPSNYPGVSGPLAHVDVRSMYPWLMATRDFPCKLLTVRGNPPVRHVRGLLETHCVIATVVVHSRFGEIPFRDEHGVCYPVGQFVTGLCGDELRSAIDNDEVKQVITCCLYEPGKPFAELAKELLTLRQHYIAEGNKVWEQFVKFISNGLPGKLAQRKGEWKRRTDMTALKRWGEWYSPSNDGSGNSRYMGRAGLVWEYTRSVTNNRPLASVFAYLTSYGRHMMRLVRESCPIRSVVSMDTDGLWCLPHATACLPIHTSADEIPPGCMRITATSTAGQWYSPKHYWTERGWVLSGYHQPSYDNTTRGFTDRHITHTVGGPKGEPPTVVKVTKRHTSLSLIPVSGIVGPDGWVYPRPINHRASRAGY